MSESDQVNTTSNKRRVNDDEDVECEQEAVFVKRGGVRRTVPGGKIDCEGRCVPDGFLYHVVGAEEQEQPFAPVRLLVRPGAPACWAPMNAGFFVGRHIAKFLPDVPQYACAKAAAAAKVERRRAVPIKCPATSSYAWPAYEVDFADTIEPAGGGTPQLSQLYASAMQFGNANIYEIAAFLKSDASDYKVLGEVDATSALGPYLGTTNDDTVALRLEFEQPGVASTLLLATHCLILNRDIARDPGPARLVDSIPPVMRHDGMPDAATLERWADLTRWRCRASPEPLLAWGAATIQFGEGPRAKQKSLWDVVHQQVTTGTATNKSRGCSHHDAWIESAFRVASVPFVAFLLKRRGVILPEQQLPLADMPVWSRAFEQPLVALHPLAPKRVFNIAAVLAALMIHTELQSAERPQV